MATELNPTYKYDNVNCNVDLMMLDLSTPVFRTKFGDFQVTIRNLSLSQCTFSVNVIYPISYLNDILSVQINVVFDFRARYFSIIAKPMQHELVLPNYLNFKVSEKADYPEALESGGMISIRSVSVWIHRDPASLKPLNEIASMLNVKAFSDVSLVPEGSSININASRLVLSEASPFFRTLFLGEWSQTCQADQPVKLTYSCHAVFIVLVHIYTGWLPGDDFPSKQENILDLMKQISLTQDDLDFDLMSEVMGMAEMLELKLLAVESAEELINLLRIRMTALMKQE